MKKYDVVIAGAGILGLSTAFMLKKKYPHYSVAILEKEARVAMHQTGHNSGVVHSGIYYKNGSAKAKNCLRGKELLLQFCTTHSIPLEKLHKLIVATEEREFPVLEMLYNRGKENGLADLCLIEREELREKEPHIEGKKAIYNPTCHIVSFPAVAEKLQTLLMEQNADFYFLEPLEKISILSGYHYLETPSHTFETTYFINCCGLYCDHIAEKSVFGKELPGKILPFRGEYYDFTPDAAAKINGLIYPVPNPELPFLCVHITKMLDGGAEAGPNAVLSLAKEGYKKTNVHLAELLEMAAYPGLWKLAKEHLSTGVYELYRSLSKKAFLQSVRKFMPEITENQMVPGNSGVRAQLVLKNGKLCDDFSLIQNGTAMHVLNAPSPAATSCFSIGEHIVETLFGA